MADEAASLLVKITADGSQAIGVLNGVSATVNTLADSNATLLNKVSSIGTLAGTVGRTVTKTFGVATVAGLTASAKAAGQLNKELANIGTLSVPTERLKEFKGQIQDIAIATGKSTSDISDGTYQVVSAFGDASDTMEKVEINAKAAKAGLATTTDSINLTSAVTKAYGDTSARVVQHVADLAFKTVELGQTTFPELAQSMQQVTSLSKELGVSQEELFGTYATLTGVTGNAAEVQTQLKAVYTALLKPSDNMADVIGKLGYESGYSMIKTLGFAGTLNALKQATNGSEEEMLGLFNNVRAMPAVMALTGAQSETFSTKLEKMKNASGAATDAFKVQTEGVAKTGFTLEQAKEKMQVAAQNFGESAAPLIADVADVVDRASSAMANLNDEQRKAIINTGVNITKAGAALAIGGKVINMGTKLVGTIKTVGGALGKISVSGTGLGIAGAITAPIAVVEGYELIAEHVTKAIENNSKLGQSYKDLYKQWQDTDTQVSHLESLRSEYDKLNESINSGTLNPEELESAKNRINDIMQEIKAATNDDTIKLMIDTGEFDTALAMAVSNAKDSANEIKDSLDMIYQDKPKKAVSEGYDAVSKGTSYGIDYKNQREEMRQWLQQATEYKMQYKSIMDEMNIAYKNGSSERIKAAASEREAFVKWLSDSDFTKAYEKFTGNTFKFGDMDEVIQEIQNVSSAYREISDNIESMDERAKNGRESLQAMADVATMDAMNLNGFKDMQEVIENGGTAIDNVCNQLKSTMTDWGFANQDIAAQVALVKNGFQDLQSAISGNALDAVVNDFISQGKQLGLTEGEIASKAALMKNGFSDIQQAISSGNIKGVVNDLGKLGNDMGMSVEQVNTLAHSLGLIPQEKHIEFTENGYEVVEGAVEKLKELDTENVHVSVTADGDITVLNQATGETENLKMDGAVSLQVNADGNIDILGEAGEKLGEIKNDPSATVTVNTEVDASEEEEYSPDDKDATVKFGVNHDEVDKYTPENKTATVTYTVKTEGAIPKAKGTQNFEGGLAMVNDETGINDPRELIVDKGRAFIPQGKNVLLPLSKGAKVYTASQTKAIMSGLGIPRYASGKDNSDAFTSAKDDWTHYTKTHAVTTAQELEKWLEFQEKFKSNDKDIADIEEQIFSIMQKQTKEFNEQSKAYLEKHSAINDWGDNGDTPLDAFKRIKDRNYQDLQDAKITWDDYVDNVSDAGETLYDDMKSYSDSWLEHQQKYHSMSIDDYISGIDREAERLEEFYANDVINYQKYVEEKQALEEKRYDAVAQKNADEYSAWQKDADAWQELRNTYDDWDKFGDSEEDFLQRKIDKVKWFYDKGKMSFEEFIDDTNKYSMELYKSQSSAVDELLQKQQDYISNIKDEFSKQEQELRDSWDVADRKTDMSEVQAQLDVYANSVTDKGQQKYKELQEQMKQLQRDEELYQLQKKNNATIESLEAEYKQMEDGKKNILTGLQNADINISAYVATITDKVSATGGNIESLLSRMLDKFDSFKIENNSMSDNRKIINNFLQMTPEEKQDALNKCVGL